MRPVTYVSSDKVEYYPEQQPLVADEDEDAHPTEMAVEYESPASSSSRPSTPEESPISPNNDESQTQEDLRTKVPQKISESLAALGVYARSMKPRKGWLAESA